ncbi:MAG TPA: hypothetical protein G4O19_04865, partial [Dehalococcoidia bacterium]|nr:hypothetical protein [Dehalococcoidia bacterium]
MEYHVFKTNQGWMAALGSSRGLVSVSLPLSSVRAALESLCGDTEQATQSPERFQDLSERFQKYFSGYEVSFPDELDLSLATPFQREVWQ